MVANSDNAILSRVVDASGDDLEPEIARALLRLTFGVADVERVEELGRLAQDGELSAEQQAEYGSYVRVGHFLSLLHSKARQSLQRLATA